MKKIILLFSLCILAVTSATMAQKKTYEFAHEKQVSKTYALSSSDKISISNQFGDVVVKTWSNNEIKVDVSIKISSDIQEVADNLFANIEIDNGKKGNEVYFKTRMENTNDQKRGYRGSSNSSININYTIMMPAGQELDIANKFGKMTLPDLSGKVSIKEEFGGLVAGKLSNPQDIDVRFSTLEIDGLQNGSLDLQFIKNVALIKNATGTLTLNAKFCKDNGVIIPTNGLQSLDAKLEHSLVYLVAPKDAQMEANVKTHFGSFKNKTDLKFQDDVEDDNRRSPRFDYKYFYTSPQPRTKVTMKGNFTDFIVTHDIPELKDYNKKTVSL
ncbi:MAG: hypothetical protein J0I41_08385 [Filimonas sp.]|nr:hypothetical protein [Filimonas sp.]